MNNQEYEKAKAECWAEFCKAYPAFSLKTTARVIFKFVFDRDYALGKQFGNSEQVDAEEAAEKHADELSVPSNIPGALVPLLHDIAQSSYLQGAQDFIGRQKKGADTVIHGWVARDLDGEVFLYENKPERGCGEWLGRISSEFDFQQLKWDSEPIECEIILKRKKK